MSNTNKQKDAIKNILVVALSVCLVAAIIVSGAAVLLKPMRLANKALDRNKHILITAGLFTPNKMQTAEIPALFDRFDIALVDLAQGRLLSAAETEALGIDVAKYDQRRAAKDAALSDVLRRKDDIASISRRARYSLAYMLKQDGKIETIVLPIHGYGLWSTLYGFVALKGDFNTVAGITFYEHAETAGLGGEVDNPNWKALWPGKQIYSADGAVALRLVKGNVDSANKNAIHQVDGLSGATLTSRGVQNMVYFWLGEQGFGPLLKGLRG